MENQELRDIIEGVRKKQEASFEQLYTHALPYVKAYLNKLGSQFCDYDDIIQEVFMEVFKSIDKLRNETCFRKWLYMIARSKHYDFYRTFYKYKTEDVEESNYYETKKEYLPQEAMEEGVRAKIIATLLQTISQEQAMILQLRYLKEMSMSEIAEYCTIPIGTVKSRLYLAKQHFLNCS